MDRIRTILLGVGYWGKNLLRNLVASQEIDLVGICDISEHNLKYVNRVYPGIKVFKDYEEMLDILKPVAAVIATPAGLHYQHTVIALEHNCHVLVEKPMATGIADAREMVDRASEKNRVLTVGHTFLHNNVLHQVKQYIDSGELGEVYYLYSRRLNMGRVRSDVDALWNLAPHDVSIMNYLLGSMPLRVSGTAMCYLQKKIKVSDVAFARLIYPDGRIAHIHVSWLDPQKKREVVIVGSKKMLVYDDVNSDRHIQVYDKCFEKEMIQEVNNFAQFKTKLRAGNLIIPNISLQEPLAAEVAHFVTCVREGKASIANGENGFQVVAVLDAITKSIDRGGLEIEIDINKNETGA